MPIVDPFDAPAASTPSPRARQREVQIQATESDIQTDRLRRAQIGADLADRPLTNAEKLQRLRINQATESDQVREKRANANKAEIEAGNAKARAATPAGDAVQDERQTAMQLGRLVDSRRHIADVSRRHPEALRPGLLSHFAEKLPMIGDVAANASKSPERRQVEANQLDMLDAALWLSTGAAYNPEQLRTMSRAYFPQPLDDPATVRSKNQKLNDLIRNARVRAGVAAAAVPAVPGMDNVGDATGGFPAGFKIRQIGAR